MSLPEVSTPQRARDLIASLGDGRALSDADMQALFAAAVRIYADRMEERDEPLAAFPADAGITATHVMVAVTAMLKAVNVQVFELGMWQAWSGR
ncbi:MAG TPA: hypothetical protein VG100_07620 [Xanthobacteraceae bacterium]|jgi:hypothetical protein|nr:hypothetical protein [Xanthobacteraceae bacterium]